MQQNANSSKARKEWEVQQLPHQDRLLVVRTRLPNQYIWHTTCAVITGASPAYVEELVERLNIHINNLLYELGRIPR